MSTMSPPPKHLFTLPIGACDPHPGGTLTATEPHPKCYLLTFSSPPDNRLTTPFVTTFLAALDIIEFSHPPGVVITTSAIPKFYSNGLDLDHAQEDPDRFFPEVLYPLFRRLLTYPMPTLAWLNGHAFAAGLMLAMYHDYRLMNSERGAMVAVNELDFGAPLKAPMCSIFRVKCPAVTHRDMVLEARRFKGAEALQAGIVDGLVRDGVADSGGSSSTPAWMDVVAFIEARKLVKKGATGIYAFMKQEMYRDVMIDLASWTQDEARGNKFIESDDVRLEEGREKVKRLIEELKAKL